MSDSNKVGSDADAADAASGSGDFGVDPTDRIERTHASASTEQRDPGKAQPRSGTGPRTSGVGGDDVGRGSSSGGDVDVGNDALTGVADPHQHSVRQGTSGGDPADRPVLDPPVVHSDPARAGTLDNASSTSADGMNNETQHDNQAFKGDITSDEASGNSSR